MSNKPKMDDPVGAEHVKFGHFVLKPYEGLCEDCLQKIYVVIECPSGTKTRFGFDWQPGDVFCINCAKGPENDEVI